MILSNKKDDSNEGPKSLEEVVAESKRQRKRNERLIMLGTIVLVILAFVSIVLLNLNKSQGSTTPGADQVTATPTAELSTELPSEVIERSVSPQSEAEAKAQALDNLAFVLEGLRTDEASLDATLTALGNGDYSSIPEDVRDLIYIPEGNQDIDSLLGSYEKTSLQSLVSIGTYGVSGEGKTYTGSEKDLSEIIYMPETGLMYLPLSSIKDAKASSYIFEMVYVDSQWKIIPINVLVQTYQSSLTSATNSQ